MNIDMLETFYGMIHESRLSGEILGMGHIGLATGETLQENVKNTATFRHRGGGG
jgi:hypothetical protein